MLGVPAESMGLAVFMWPKLAYKKSAHVLLKVEQYYHDVIQVDNTIGKVKILTYSAPEFDVRNKPVNVYSENYFGGNVLAVIAMRFDVILKSALEAKTTEEKAFQLNYLIQQSEKALALVDSLKSNLPGDYLLSFYAGSYNLKLAYCYSYLADPKNGASDSNMQKAVKSFNLSMDQLSSAIRANPNLVAAFLERADAYALGGTAELLSLAINDIDTVLSRTPETEEAKAIRSDYLAIKSDFENRMKQSQ
jgi:hypothetical protein